MKPILLLCSLLTLVSFTGLPPAESRIAGKTWYFQSFSNEYIELILNKPDASGNGTFSWIVGKGIPDKRDGKYSLKNNNLTLNYYWAGVKTITTIYRVEHETKNGFLLVEQKPDLNDKIRSFLFTSVP